MLFCFVVSTRQSEIQEHTCGKSSEIPPAGGCIPEVISNRRTTRRRAGSDVRVGLLTVEVPVAGVDIGARRNPAKSKFTILLCREAERETRRRGGSTSQIVETTRGANPTMQARFAAGHSHR